MDRETGERSGRPAPGDFGRYALMPAGLKPDTPRAQADVDDICLFIPTWEGWLYLATVIDIASRRVVGFAMADHMRTELVADALANAVAARNPAAGVVFHSDRGCQYTSRDYATLAADLDVRLSVARTGQCWDNALAESFFASLKGEALDHRAWPTRASARREVVDYIAWFNGHRIHSALGYQTPNDYENTHHHEGSQQAA